MRPRPAAAGASAPRDRELCLCLLLQIGRNLGELGERSFQLFDRGAHAPRVPGDGASPSRTLLFPQIICDRRKLFQRRFEISDDVGGDNIGSGEIRAVFQGLESPAAPSPALRRL
jgi:hypothetical protein